MLILVLACFSLLFTCSLSNTNCAEFTTPLSNFTNLAAGTTPGPTLSCETSRSASVDWYQILNGEVINIFGLINITTDTSLQEFSQNLNETLGIEINPSSRNITFSTVRTKHHGQYQCKIGGSCEVYSVLGSMEVQGPVVMEFAEQTDADNIILHAKAGQEMIRNFRVYGAPSPTLRIAKQGSDGVFRILNDNRITVNLTRLVFRSIQLKDSGRYTIWGNNSHGNEPFRFNISVTGVDAPTITLSQIKHTPQQYGSSVSIMCTIQDSAYEVALRLYWAFINRTEIPFQGPVAQKEMGNTTTVLTISPFKESHNGNYICFANNSNNDTSATVSFIGPPAKANTPTVTVSSTTARIEWTEPISYGADIVDYQIEYRIEENSNQRIVKTIKTNSSSTRFVEPKFCPGGYYSFRIAAINEYGSVGEYSEYSGGDTITISPECPTTTGTSSSTVTTSSSSDKSQTVGGTVVVTTTSSSTSTLSATPTPTSVTTPSKASNTLPLAAGAAAGTVVLILATVCLLVMVVFCWVSVSRRSSRRQGKTQWHHPGEEDNIDASLSTQSLPDKSSELHVDFVGIPSPLPATPGYGPLYIDPCYEFPRENLELTDILYDGNYTVIYKAKALGIKENKSIEVAVKTIKDEFLDIDDLTSSLVMEMEQLSQLEPHPNIVGLIRVCTVGRPVFMVMEYMCHGDLLGFLRATRNHVDMYTVFPGTKNLPTNVKLRSRDLLHIIGQVASGMQFLSELKISHGALCARNILVGTSMEVKVFNIGAHNIDNGESNDSLIRWLAPEVFVDGHRTTYSDIWSFGILMWEVVTVGGTPYSEVNLDELYTHLMSGMRLQRPAHCTEPIYDIMSSCWEAIPQHRPLFIEIIDQLQSLSMQKTSLMDLRNYNEMQYSQFDLNEASQMSVL